MYVFHDRRLDALERVPDVVAIAVERLVEVASFGSEPEYLPSIVGLASLCRWYDQCPDVAGLEKTRRSLGKAIAARAASIQTIHGSRISAALAGGDKLSPVAEPLRVAMLREAGALARESLKAGDVLATCTAVGDLGAAWLGSFLHPRTVFNKLVGYVLDPDEKQPASPAIERLDDVIRDFDQRIPQRHAAVVMIQLPAGKRRPPPALGGIQVIPVPGEVGRFQLRFEVDASDPGAAASQAGSRFADVLHAWRSSAPDLNAQLATSIDITMPDGKTVPIPLRPFRVAPPRVTVMPSWERAPVLDQPRFIAAAEAVARSRQEMDDGRVAQAVSTLWSATESVLRRDAEASILNAQLQTRIAAPFLKYFPSRQLALLGVFLDSSKATHPRTRSPVEPKRLWADLATGDLRDRITGRRVLLRHRLDELLVTFQDASALQVRLADIRHRIHDVLFAARTIRNVFVHSRIRVAAEYEERYVYRWLETLLDVTLNSMLGQSRKAGFTVDAHLASLPAVLESLERRVAAGPPYEWLFGP